MTLTFENIFFFPNKQRRYEHFFTSQLSKNDLWMFQSDTTCENF